MKLKTLLLGSAASLMAVTSSFAADAVVAEPEAVEYVRVCDAYGAGYFYIPGTERCMQLSGEVRFQYAVVDSDNGTGNDVNNNWAYRARFAVRTANESDFGTIRTYMRFEANYGQPLQTTTNFTLSTPFSSGGNLGNLVSPGRDLGLQEMTLDIGGAKFGIADSYWTTNTGYGILGAINDGYYNYDQAIYAQYTYEIAGFAVTAGVEQTDNSPVFGQNEAENPSIYVGANYGGSWGQVAGTYIYDTILDEGSYKVGLDLVPFEGFRAEAFFGGGDGRHGQRMRNVGTTFANPAGDYAYGVGAQYTFGEFTPYALYTGNDGTLPDYVAAGLIYRPGSTDGLVLQGEARFDVEDSNTALLGEQNLQAYTFRLIKSF